MSSAALGIHPLMDALADRIRLCWQDLPDLQPLEVDPQLEAISGSLDGEELFIRNELRRSRGLRKLHLETARLGAGLQILHCVFFPDPQYDLPVFGADIVAGRGVVSAAIVDLSPVGAALPAGVTAALEALPPRRFSQERDLPDWGTIFSPHVRFVRPSDSAEENQFVALVGDFLSVIAEASRTVVAQPIDHPDTVDRHQGQLS
jgi:phycocyanobilin:ferredoxin oxidoreductase